MKILLTGATGFVGKHLLEALLKTNNDITILLRDRSKLIDMIGQYNVVSLNVIDLQEANWKTAVKESDPKVVIHLAAFLTSDDNEDAIEKLIAANINFGTQLLDALKQTRLKLFINTGTFAEYFSNSNSLEPAYLYAATKSAFRHFLSYYSSICEFSVLNVIPYTIYGGRNKQKKIIDRVYDSLDAKEGYKMSPGEQKLDFIHIDDVIAFYVEAIQHIPDFENQKYTEVHLGTGIGTTPKEIASTFEQLTKKKAHIIWGGIPYRQRDTLCSVANKLLAKNVINWVPKIKIEEGIKKYIKSIETE